MKNWHIGYLDPVESWLNKLTKLQLKTVAKELRLLGLCGNLLKMPHSRPLGNGLFELREYSYGLRLYYAFDKNREITILHAGDKDSQENDIENARQILKQLEAEL
jgi:putative addiction module killer protein